MLSERDFWRRTTKQMNVLKAMRILDEDIAVFDAVLSRQHVFSIAGFDHRYIRFYLAYAGQYMANTNIGNRLGLCGLTLCSFTSNGLPIGLLLNGKPFQEATVLRAGYAYEQATEWSTTRPNLDWAS